MKTRRGTYKPQNSKNDETPAKRSREPKDELTEEIEDIEMQIDQLQKKKQRLADIRESYLTTTHDPITGYELENAEEEDHEETAPRLVAPEPKTTTIPVEILAELARNLRPQDTTLPTFRGDALDWPSFIKRFRTTTEESQISDEVNLNRLNAALRGPARDLVRSLLDNPCYVYDIIELLEDTYGSKRSEEEAALAMAKEIKPMRMDLENIAQFHLNVMKIQRRVQLCNNRKIAQRVTERLVCLLPRTMLFPWTEYQEKLQRPQKGTLDDFAVWIRKLKQSCSLNYLASTTHERDNQKRPEKSREKYEKYQDDQHQRGDNTGQKNKQRSHQGDAKPKLVLIHRHITEDTQEKCLLECNDRTPTPLIPANVLKTHRSPNDS